MACFKSKMATSAEQREYWNIIIHKYLAKIKTKQILVKT